MGAKLKPSRGLIELFFDSRFAAAEISKVIELGLPYVTFALNSDALNQRAMQLKGSFHANTMRHLPERKC